MDEMSIASPWRMKIRCAVRFERPKSVVFRDFTMSHLIHTEDYMKLNQLVLDELEREAELSRRALQNVPAGKADWKPHDKSMIFGYLADMVANIPNWVAMIITQPELDIAPVGGPTQKREPMNDSAAFVAALDKAMAAARSALQQTTDDHLATNWRLLAGGKPVIETSRYLMIRDTINHWVHHRGQMTVYLRLMGAKVPALYGPSADDQRF
jgi:uncharacterized damage-inducible protein DinB